MNLPRRWPLRFGLRRLEWVSALADGLLQGISATYPSALNLSPYLSAAFVETWEA